MSEELTAGALAEAAQAEERREQEIPSPEPHAPASEDDGARDRQVDSSGAPIETGESEKAAESFAEWTEAGISAETDAFAAAAGEPAVEDAVEFTATAADTENARIKAIIEAVIYITDEPLTAQQIAQACGKPIDEVKRILDTLNEEYARADRGLTIRELAGGYKMSTKPEHHEEIRAFVKNLKPPLKLSLAALETLAVIAYKQPITAPEIMEIRGVQGAGVLKTLLDRKLIATAGRKNVVGKPILYKTTREFLIQFGLKDLSELPTLKEFEELGRLALSDSDDGQPVTSAGAPPPETVHEPGHTPVEMAQDPESPPVDASGAVLALDPIEEPDREPPPHEDPGADVPPIQEPPPEPENPEPPQKADGDPNA